MTCQLSISLSISGDMRRSGALRELEVASLAADESM